VSEENPWEARTLEWLVPTPVPTDNFEEVPLVVSGPYDYGLAQSSPMAILNPSRQHAQTATQINTPGAL
jgi:cytochrome c oxidase subunit 1